MKKNDIVEISERLPPACHALFDDHALTMLDRLLAEFAERRHALLGARRCRQTQFAAGDIPQLDIDWTGAANTVPVPNCLNDRRIELHTAPVAEALLVASDSSAATVVVDLENALPGLTVAVAGQALLLDFLTARAKQAKTGEPALLLAPRALDREESLLHWHAEQVPAALLDVLLYVLHNNANLTAAGHGPYLHLSRIDSPDEAVFWSDVLRWLETEGLVNGEAVKVTVGLDSVHANFSMHGILSALQDYATAVTTDHYAYLRSFVHTFGDLPQFILPDRAELTPDRHFLRARGQALVRSAHQRGMHALAACTASLPPDAGQGSRTVQWLRSEIEREARDGFDGCTVTEPALIDIARESFDRMMPGQHQLHRLLRDTHITGADLLQVVKGKITESGLRQNIATALLGLVATAAGKASLRINDAYETAASIELAADQLWQWRWLETGVLDDGRIIDGPLLKELISAESARLDAAPEPLQAAITLLKSHIEQREIPARFLATAA